MTSEELAGYVDLFVRASQSRVLGTGHDQYAQGDRQVFETMPLEELFEYAHEEFQDVAVYATMLQIRLWRLQGEIARRQTEAALPELTRASVEGLVRGREEAEQRAGGLALNLTEARNIIRSLRCVTKEWRDHVPDWKRADGLEQQIEAALRDANSFLGEEE